MHACMPAAACGRLCQPAPQPGLLAACRASMLACGCRLRSAVPARPATRQPPPPFLQTGKTLTIRAHVDWSVGNLKWSERGLCPARGSAPRPCPVCCQPATACCLEAVCLAAACHAPRPDPLGLCLPALPLPAYLPCRDPGGGGRPARPAAPHLWGHGAGERLHAGRLRHPQGELAASGPQAVGRLSPGKRGGGSGLRGRQRGRRAGDAQQD